MKLFKKSTLSLALTAALTGGAMMGVTTPAQAVNVAHDGLGQVLVFPYYTTRSNWETYFHITNTSDKTVVMKVRWREGRNSRDVRDFNVIMSPYDVWTAATVNFGINADNDLDAPAGFKGEDAAGLVTNDTTCTYPQLVLDDASMPSSHTGKGLRGVNFTNYAYIRDFGANIDNRDGAPQGSSRTQEGYFEVIEMGVATDAAVISGAEHIGGNGFNTQVPRSCNNVAAALEAGPNLDPPINALKGRAILINKNKGSAAAYDPLTLANFSNIGGYFPPDDVRPHLGNAVPPRADYVNSDGTLHSRVLPGRADAVSRLITHSAVINDYNVAGDNETDWVLTFPTKNFYVDRALYNTNTFAQIPFGTAGVPFTPFTEVEVGGEAFNGESCVDVDYSSYDNEEFQLTTTTTTGFSPKKRGDVNQAVLCNEANVIHFGDSDVFGTELNANAGQLPGDRGWSTVSFGDGDGRSLPVIGLRMEVRKRGTAAESFGFANDHAYKTPSFQ